MNRNFEPYQGPPSKLYPNTYKGRAQNGGYIARNQKPNSANSPSFKGKLWVEGVGWYWVSAWSSESHSGKGTYLSLKLNPMSDEEATKYCRPKDEHAQQRQDYQSQTSNSEYRDSDIPF